MREYLRVGSWWLIGHKFFFNIVVHLAIKLLGSKILLNVDVHLAIKEVAHCLMKWITVMHEVNAYLLAWDASNKIIELDAQFVSLFHSILQFIIKSSITKKKLSFNSAFIIFGPVNSQSIPRNSKILRVICQRIQVIPFN